MEGPDIVQVGVDHLGASLDRIAQLHLVRRQADPRPSSPGVALATCHRLELYLEGVPVVAAPEAFRSWAGGGQETQGQIEGLGLRLGEEAGRHLLRVTSGLESAVLGEDQILQQVRQAYRVSCEESRTGPGPVLHRLFHAAFRAGRRVRGETALATGSRSLAGAAVAALHRSLGGIRGKSVLVLGAGEMGAVAARQLQERGAEVLLCNRSPARAAALAARLRLATRPWEWRAALLSQVDGLICATGAAEPVVLRPWLERASCGRSAPLVVVDLGVPRNVETLSAQPEGLQLIDMTDLARRMEQDRERQASAVAEAESIVEQELRGWLSWAQKRQQVGARSGSGCSVGRRLAAG
jgi:glutamyl-tRNA reductase